MRGVIASVLIVCGTVLLASPLIHSGMAIANSAWVVGVREDISPGFTFERLLPMPERIFLPVIGGVMIAIGIAVGVFGVGGKAGK